MAFGVCGRCARPWNEVEHHSTQYDESNGCFPLCEECWAELETPEQRLPFYRVLFKQWEWHDTKVPKDQRMDVGTWPSIEAAVLSGE